MANRPDRERGAGFCPMPSKNDARLRGVDAAIGDLCRSACVKAIRGFANEQRSPKPDIAPANEGGGWGWWLNLTYMQEFFQTGSMSSVHTLIQMGEELQPGSCGARLGWRILILARCVRAVIHVPAMKDCSSF